MQAPFVVHGLTVSLEVGVDLLGAEPEPLADADGRKLAGGDECVDRPATDREKPRDLVHSEQGRPFSRVGWAVVGDHAPKVPHREPESVTRGVTSSRFLWGVPVSSIWISVPEVEGEMRFDFALDQGDDGSLRRVCVGFEIANVITRSMAGDPIEPFELTAVRVRDLAQRFSSYRAIAEAILPRSEEGLEAASRERAVMLRRPGKAHDDAYLAVFAEHLRGWDGTFTDFCIDKHISRKQGYAIADKARERGFEIPRRVTQRVTR